MKGALPKFGVISQALPPLISGQSLVLFRLLDELPAEGYCLISSQYDAAAESGPSLPAPRHRLRSFRRRLAGRQGRLFLWLGLLLSLCCVVYRAVEIGRIIRSERLRSLLACSGNLYDIPAACLASIIMMVKLDLYIFDDYTYQWDGIHRKIAELFERMAIKKTAKVIVTNEYLKNEYDGRYGIASEIIYHPALVGSNVVGEGITVERHDKEKNIVYAGSIYRAQLDALIDLSAALHQQGQPGMKLLLYTPQKREELERHGLGGPRLEFHEAVPANRLDEVFARADLLFLPLAFASGIPEVIATALPLKTIDYLASGLPVLLYAPEQCFVSHYFRENRCGLVITEKQGDALAAGLERIFSDPELVRQMTANARRCAARDFDLKILREKFLAVLRTA